jgi:2-hydroxy-3-oxopropionate reductase
MSQSIALIGAGAMGGAIGTRLLETGSKLAVFDLDPDKVAALVEKGATAAQSAAEAARGAEAVITSLNASRIVGLAAFGKDGISEAAAPGTLIIDMSSIDPDVTRKFAMMAVEQGLAWVDAPLSGGAPKALIGELTLMMGGTAEDVARAQSVLGSVASNMTHMGGPGAGQTGTAMPMTALCAEIHRMLTAAGLGGEDQAAVMEFFNGAGKDIQP